jgi:hypothetical protein
LAEDAEPEAADFAGDADSDEHLRNLRNLRLVSLLGVCVLIVDAICCAVQASTGGGSHGRSQVIRKKGGSRHARGRRFP